MNEYNTVEGEDLRLYKGDLNLRRINLKFEKY